MATALRVDGASSLVASASPAITERKGSRLAHLDGLRALAALYVVIHHVWRTVWFQEAGRQPQGILGPLTGGFAFGHLAVAVFIVVSGYSLMLPLVRGDGTLAGGTRGFLPRRARRLLPPYFGALLFSLALASTLVSQRTGTVWDVSVPVTPVCIVTHALLVQNILCSGDVNYVFWSIAVEWQIYFTFPLLIILWRRYGIGATLLAVWVAAFVVFVATAGTLWAGLGPQYFALFVAGMAGAAVVHAPDGSRRAAFRDRFRWRLFAGVLGVVLAVLCITSWTAPYIWAVPFMDLLAGLGGLAVLVLAGRSSGSTLRQLLAWRPFVLVGGFSYSLYLTHAPLLQLLWEYGVAPLRLGDGVAFGLLALGGIPLSLVAAYGFYRVCERPFLNRRPVC